MARERITLEALPRAIARTGRTVEREIRKGLGRAARKARAHLAAKSPKDTGELRNAWEVVRGSGDVAEIIGNDAPYVGVVELGTGPHPVKPEDVKTLREWALRHFAKARAAQKYLRGARRASAVDNLVGAMVKKIETRGEKPTYFVRRQLERIAQMAVDEINRGLDTAAGKR
jgi:hypothetical protein